ncbi:hypothetical protein D9M69_109540 [compost metagenome]
MGQTRQAIIRAIVAGERDPKILARHRHSPRQGQRRGDHQGADGQLARGTPVRAGPGTGHVVRSEWDLQRRSHVPAVLNTGTLMRIEFDQLMQDSATATEARRIIESYVHCGLCTFGLSDLRDTGPRAGQPAWSDLPDTGDAARGYRGSANARSPRSLPDMPCLRDGLPIRGRLRSPDRNRTEGNRPPSTSQQCSGGMRSLLRRSLESPLLVRSSPRLAWALRSIAPERLRALIPARPAQSAWPTTPHSRLVLTLCRLRSSELDPAERATRHWRADAAHFL